MSALWITHSRVIDPEAYARYASLAVEAITAHGGVFLVRGGRHLQLEGEDRPRNVVVRFPSLEQAEACYRSEAYQKALALGQGGAERDLVIVEESGSDS